MAAWRKIPLRCTPPPCWRRGAADRRNLTGPLNALEQELRLEDANSAWQAGIADLWTSKYLFQQGNALFYRGYLAD